VQSKRPLAIVLVALALALAAGACRVPGGVDGGPAPAFCSAPVSDLPDGAPPETTPTLSVVVGTENAAQKQVATPWRDGDHVPLVAGGQGGFMIRPAFDVTAPAPLPEDNAHKSCFAVTMLAGGAASLTSLMQGVLGARIDGTTATYHVPALLGLLSYDHAIDGMSIPVTFYVNAAADKAKAGYVAMTVVPDSALAP
jgi:hypothetical protein